MIIGRVHDRSVSIGRIGLDEADSHEVNVDNVGVVTKCERGKQSLFFCLFKYFRPSNDTETVSLRYNEGDVSESIFKGRVVNGTRKTI